MLFRLLGWVVWVVDMKESTLKNVVGDQRGHTLVEYLIN